MSLLKFAKKKTGYDQGGAKNNNWKGDSAEYSAKHKRRENETGNYKKGSKCSRCGSTKNLQTVTVHGSNGNKFITLCASCHAKYDKKSNNFKKESSMNNVELLKVAQANLSQQSLLKFAEATLYERQGDAVPLRDAYERSLYSSIMPYGAAIGGGLVGGATGGFLGSAVEAFLTGNYRNLQTGSIIGALLGAGGGGYLGYQLGEEEGDNYDARRRFLQSNTKQIGR